MAICGGGLRLSVCVWLEGGRVGCGEESVGFGWAFGEKKSEKSCFPR